MIVGIPAQDGHDLTATLIKSLHDTMTGDYKIVIIDNNSQIPYQDIYGDNVEIIRNEKNVGYYAPLLQLYAAYPDERLIGLIHNDMVIYEHGWDVRLQSEFDKDDKLMLVGFCGSYEVDERGGRGGGTVVNFRGEPGYQSPAAGAKYTHLVPSACLDSLFMMFHRDAIDLLEEDWQNLPLAHFYDRIWPLKLVEKGMHVGTLGVECDHMGGMTTVANPRYHQDCMDWLDERNIPFRTDDTSQIIAAESADPRNIPSGNPETEMYLIPERRYLGYFRDQIHFIPCRIKEDYSYEAI